MKNKWLIGIVSAALAVTLSFGLAACGGDDEATAQDVITEIKDITDLGYTYDTPADYEVNGQWKLGDETYPITWSVAAVTEGVEISDYVTVGEMDAESSMVTISVTQGAIDVVYKLTATVTVGSASANVDFEHKVPASKILGADVTFDFASVKLEDYGEEKSGSDGSTYIDSLLDAEKALTILQTVGGANTNLTSVGEISKVYAGMAKNSTTNQFDGGITTSDGYLRMGTSSGNGVLTLNFSKAVAKVAVQAQGWNGNGSVRVNSGLAQALTEIPADYSFDIDPATSVKIELVGRGFMFKIAVTFAAEGAHIHRFATTGTHVAGTWTHTVQCTAEGCTLPGSAETQPCTPVLNTCSVCGNTYTAAEIVDQCATGATMEGTYRITGVIANTPQASSYGNGTYNFLIDVDGTETQVAAYYCKMGSGVDTVAQGDTVTIEGPIVFDYGKPEFKSSATIVSRTPGEGGGSGGGDDGPVDNGNFTPVTNGTPSVSGGPYYFALQANDTWYYLAGGSTTNDYWLAITTDSSAAVEITLEEATGGYYFKVGTQYLNIVEVTGSDSSSHVNSLYQTEKTSIWKWNSTYNIFTVNVSGKGEYFLGSYGTNYSKSMSASAISYLGGTSSSTQYPGKLGTLTAPDPDQTAVDGAKAALTLTTTQYSATGDYDLPTTVTGFDGVAVTWALKADTTFANGTVEGNKLKINSLPTDADATVQLTATFTKNGKTATKDYSVKVLKQAANDGEKAQQAADSIEFTQLAYTAVDAEGVTLPTTTMNNPSKVEWKVAEDEEDNDGYVSVTGGKLLIEKLPAAGQSVTITIKVEVTVGQETRSKTFDITVTNTADPTNYGTKEAPISVEAALAIATAQCVTNGNYTKQPVTMKGIAKNTPAEKSSSSGKYYTNLTVIDETKNAVEILVYSVNLESGVAIPNPNDVIIVSGYITRYKYENGAPATTGTDGTIEFSGKGSDFVKVLENTRGQSTITLGAHTGANVTGITAEGGSKAQNGATFDFTVIAEAGKKIDSVTAYGKSLQAADDAGKYSFTVAGDTEVTVTTSDASAPAAVVLYTLDTTLDANKTSGNSYAGSGSKAINGVTWVCEGNGQMCPWRLGGKSSNCSGADRCISCKNAIAGKVTKVAITFGGDNKNITVNSVTLKVYSSDPTVDGAVATYTQSVTYSISGTYTVTVPESEDWSNCYYQLCVNLTATDSSNCFMSVAKIEFSGYNA